MEVLYEDNHIIVVSKCPGEIVQGDKTGDEPLSETIKRYLKEKYAKPGNVYLGVVHRLAYLFPRRGKDRAAGGTSETLRWFALWWLGLDGTSSCCLRDFIVPAA